MAQTIARTGYQGATVAVTSPQINTNFEINTGAAQSPTSVLTSGTTFGSSYETADDFALDVLMEPPGVSATTYQLPGFKAISALANSGGVSSLPIVVANVAVNDLLVATMGMTGATTVTAPAGWGAITSLGSTMSVAVFEKIATAGDVGTNVTYTFTLSGNVNATGVIASYTGGAGTINGEANTGGGTVPPATPPSLTFGPSPRKLVVEFAGADANNTPTISTNVNKPKVRIQSSMARGGLLYCDYPAPVTSPTTPDSFSVGVSDVIVAQFTLI